jgi:hypothetical protein
MQGSDDVPFEVLLRCDLCLNPIAIRVHDGLGGVCTRQHIFICGRYVCGLCAPILGLYPFPRFFDRNTTYLINNN